MFNPDSKTFKYLAKFMDMIGGLEGVKKIGQGKMTFLCAIALFLTSVGFLIFAYVLWSNGQMTFDQFFNAFQICSGFIGAAVVFLFQRRATARVEAKVDASMEQNVLIAKNTCDLAKLESLGQAPACAEKLKDGLGK